jgi:DNA-binding transcriptional MocR family regulator
VLAAIRREIERRHGFAVRALAGQRVQSHPASPHLWLSLPRGWSRAAFVERARRNGVAVLGSDAFAVTEAAPEAVRVCLGAARSSEEARRAVTQLAMTLREPHGLGPAIV